MIRAFAIMCNQYGEEVYKQDVTDEVIRMAGSLAEYELMMNTNPSNYENIEEAICEPIAEGIAYEFSLQGDDIDMSYIEFREVTK